MPNIRNSTVNKIKKAVHRYNSIVGKANKRNKDYNVPKADYKDILSGVYGGRDPEWYLRRLNKANLKDFTTFIRDEKGNISITLGEEKIIKMNTLAANRIAAKAMREMGIDPHNKKEILKADQAWAIQRKYNPKNTRIGHQKFANTMEFRSKYNFINIQDEQYKANIIKSLTLIYPNGDSRLEYIINKISSVPASVLAAYGQWYISQRYCDEDDESLEIIYQMYKSTIEMLGY